MRRLPRILLNAATLLSLVLCAATLVAWVRSQSTTDQWRSYRVDRAGDPARARELATATYRSALAFRTADDTFVAESVPLTGHPWEKHLLPRDIAWSHESSPRTAKPSPFDDRPNVLGFLWVRLTPVPPTPPGERVEPATGTTQILILRFRGDRYLVERQYTTLALPWWLLALGFAAGPSLALRRRLAARTHPPGSCPTCGYDLRATPTRCPECGTIPTTAPTTPT